MNGTGDWSGQRARGRGRHLRSTPRALRALAGFLAVLALLLTLASASTGYYSSAAGKTTYKGGGVTIDASNSSNGYVMIKHKGSDKRLKVRIASGGKKDTYDLNGDGEYEAFPLRFGSGNYKIIVLRNTSGSAYAQLYAVTIKAKLKDDKVCFLYPNQYVWYTADYDVVAFADELCEGLSTDMEKITAVYKYVRDEVLYDYIKAITVSTGYMPNVDETLETGKGICFDIASLLAAMLRTQGVPCQLVIGYLEGNKYHAWNKVYVDGKWKMLDATYSKSGYKASDYEEERAY